MNGDPAFNLNSALKHYNETYSWVKEDCNSGRLDEDMIHMYLKHIPIRGICGDWPDEVYEICDKALFLMYDYAKEVGFVDSNTSYEDFLKKYYHWTPSYYKKSQLKTCEFKKD